jgi:hypothetical protein
MDYNLFSVDKQANQVQPVGEATGTVSGSTVGTVAAQRTGVSYNPYMGGGNNAQGAVDYLASMYTTPEQEERYRKASVQRQRIMAVGDALRHIGNIYNTVNGAPAQTFNSPVQEEKLRYQQEKGIRDASNYRYMSYQQAKAAQDAKQRQWEADYRMKSELTAAQIQSINERAEELVRHNKSLEEINKWKAEEAARMAKLNYDEKVRTNTARTGIMQQNANTNRMRAERVGGGRSGGGSNMPDYEVVTENTLNDDGRVVSQKKTRTVKREGQSTTTTKTTKKQLPGVTSSASNTTKKKRLP